MVVSEMKVVIKIIYAAVVVCMLSVPLLIQLQDSNIESPSDYSISEMSNRPGPTFSKPDDPFEPVLNDEYISDNSDYYESSNPSGVSNENNVVKQPVEEDEEDNDEEIYDEPDKKLPGISVSSDSDRNGGDSSSGLAGGGNEGSKNIGITVKQTKANSAGSEVKDSGWQHCEPPIHQSASTQTQTQTTQTTTQTTQSTTQTTMGTQDI